MMIPDTPSLKNVRIVDVIGQNEDDLTSRLHCPFDCPERLKAAAPVSLPLVTSFRPAPLNIMENQRLFSDYC